MDAEAWRAAKGVLAEALLCPPGERDAFVDARCADPELRRELHAYLNEYDEHFLESVITVSEAIDSTNAADDGEQLPDIHPGDHIGPYVVLDRLGAGGMGHVFLGSDTRLQRKVALKCLIASASAAELRSRMLHEARSAARITHPNIAIVHDVVEHGDRPFLVMEYVEGESLAALIKRERPSVDRIVTMVRQLASALAAAHAQGIVHRDLKPANIQVTPDGSVKVLDFGVAHAMSAAAGMPGAVTQAGVHSAGLTVPMATSTLQADRRVMHPGTPAYMSPEQMFGRAIDQRSDIYSLGVIVYEMATGHRPYATDDPLEVVLTLSRDFIKSGDSAGNVPAQINDIVSKMLAVRPEDRYQTAGELENALVLLTAREAVPAASASQRRMRVALRAAAVMLTAVAGAAILGYLETAAFNRTLGRTPPFDAESPAVWLRVGLQSLFLPSLYLIALFVVRWSVRFAVRVLRLSRKVDRLMTEGATRTITLTQRLGLDDPAVFGQAVAGAGFVAFVAIVVRFYSFIHAWASLSAISTQPAAELAMLQSIGRGRVDAQIYQFVLIVLLLAFCAAAARIHRLRAAQPLRRGGTALALVLAMAMVTLVFDVWPYRILFKNAMPRLDLAGDRCFELGASDTQLLIHCPTHMPRNSVVSRTDPSITRPGLIESLFDPPKKFP